MTGEDLKNRKEHRFYILRPGDGRYLFKCNSPKQRDDWTLVLNKVITVRLRMILNYFSFPKFAYFSKHSDSVVLCYMLHTSEKFITVRFQ